MANTTLGRLGLVAATALLASTAAAQDLGSFVNGQLPNLVSTYKDIHERFGKPDLAVALHDTNTGAAGTVAIVSGPAVASSTSVDVVLRGIGGHGARPQEGKIRS